MGATALYADRPKITFGGEEEDMPVDGGRSVIAAMQRRSDLRGGQGGGKEANQDGTHPAAATVAGQHKGFSFRASYDSTTPLCTQSREPPLTDAPGQPPPPPPLLLVLFAYSR